jgi:phage terminase large subunit GpA-like protein
VNQGDPASTPQARLDVETFDVLVSMVDQVRVKARRPILQFAEEEIVIPSGPFEGRKFSGRRNPVIALWLTALQTSIENGWRRHCATGPQQSGKTLGCFVIPIMYHLFELRQTTVVGVPTLDIASDKWLEDLLPAINASRYHDLLPRFGPGSRGGVVDSRVQFGNGVTLRFMTGGGDDKSRANFTAQVLAVTETDGMDEAGSASRESDPISQLEGRTRAFGDRAKIYLECTISTEEGRTWQEIKNGTDSRVAIQCPHCRHYVTPEREHLVGWKEGTDVLDAGEKTRVCCPDCGVLWDEKDRIAANQEPVLVHKGQSVDIHGRVTGAAPRTDTLGFRWNCLNNLLQPMTIVGQEEWRASRDSDEDNAEKRMRQFFWAMPHQGKSKDLSNLNAEMVARRSTPDIKGFVPAGATQITIGVDVGKWGCHWVAIAWKPGATPHIAQYGEFSVASREMGIEAAILEALEEFRDTVCAAGWMTADGRRLLPVAGLADARYKPAAVYRFAEESRGLFLPSMGFGIGQDEGVYRPKKEVDKSCSWVGENYHLTIIKDCRVPRADVNVDEWKAWVHARWETGIGQPGAMTLYQAPPREHLNFAKMQVAERQVEEYQAGKGMVRRWHVITRRNHFFDATVYACVAGHLAGQRLMKESDPPPRPSGANRPRVIVSDFVRNG